MLSSKCYLIRALFDWIVDSNCTPHIVVNALAEGVTVPIQHVKEGQIVLNISPFAVKDLVINDQIVSFNARFGGDPMFVYVPIHAISGIYARENGRGMMFDQDEDEEGEPEPPKSPAPIRPTLRVIK